MKFQSHFWIAVPLILALYPPAGQAADNHDAPIYRITVVQRSLTAVNYGRRSGPTKIDFRGTVLSPESHGSATIEAKAGAVEIRAKFARLDSPARFGGQYLTYVLWAVSPEGQTERLGEIITNHKDDARLEVTTSLQSFGLLVTAEPYFAVSKPGPVVVMENVLRPDTAGKSEQVSAKYELLPRQGNYTVDLSPDAKTKGGAMVSQREYEAVLALYQARNAIQIAQAEDVDARARETLQKAERLQQEAEQIPDRKANSERVISLARQAAQTAEDARNIAAHYK
ncbi:MAG: hypothetical protein ABI833_04870 [Acidobacteriota bacterium]